MGLTKEQILAGDDRPIMSTACPEWGAEPVLWRPLSGEQLDWYDQVVTAKRWPEKADEADWRGLRAQLVALALCDERGSSLEFTELEIAALSKKSAAPLDRLFDEIRAASGMTAAAVKAAEKNSDADPTGSSG